MISQAISQCTMSPLPFSQRVPNSSVIIEGKVIDQKCFWDPLHQNIYTSNLIEVYKTFKGTANPYVEVITIGGIVGNRKSVVEPSLQLDIENVGVFTLNSNPLPAQFSKVVYEAYGDAQGFIKYNIAENEANEVFHKYSNISTTIYSVIQLETGSTFAVVKPYNAFFIPASISLAAPAALTSFAPTTITAGTFSVLTITGSGFGATRGTSFVEFKNADDGGGSYIQPDATAYVSWSNTSIQVRVPSRNSVGTGSAGTGQIQVDVGGAKSTSATNLTIQYSHLNIYSATAPATIYNTRHLNQQGGGYQWQMYTGFNSNAPAKTAFLSAFQKWRCGTLINWSTGPTTSVNVAASDGVNIVRFDVGSELPAMVLGRCTNWFSGCGSNPTMNWFVDELDIVFDSGTSWYYLTGTPGGSQFDFESVAIHELGHGHELGHVINGAEIMNYSIGPGTFNRTLSVNDLAGGNAVMARNATGGVCSLPQMIPLTLGGCTLGTPFAYITSASTGCIGQAVTLTDGSTGSPTAWNWNMPGGTPTSAATQNSSVIYSTAGVKTITLTASNLTGTSTAVMSVTISAAPTLTVTSTNSVICDGQTSVLKSFGATGYTWLPTASLSSGSGAIVIANPSSTTTYTITGTTAGCSSTTMLTVTVADCTGIEDLISSNEITIYPNPTNGLINIQFNDESIIKEIVISNTLGQIVFVQQNLKERNLIIDMSEFNSGVYFIKANTSKGNVLNKIIKN